MHVWNLVNWKAALPQLEGPVVEARKPAALVRQLDVTFETAEWEGVSVPSVA